jgi:hypothetical protein
MTAMGSSVFLDKKAFQGRYVPGPTGRPRYGAHSTFDGELLFANLAREIVEDVVPNDRGLRLAENTKEPRLHPIALILAHHAACRWDLPFPTPEELLDYHELILLIPFLQCQPDDRWHNYAVRMYLDNEFAIRVGNTFYGYAKEPGTLVRTDVGAHRKFEVSRSGICFASDVTTGASGSPAHYGAMREILRMPILGLKDDGTIVRSYWRRDEGATALRVTASARFIQEFVPNMARWVKLGQIPSVDEGAVRMQGLRWSMAYPPDG